MKNSDEYVEKRSYDAALFWCAVIIIGLLVLLITQERVSGVSVQREQAAIAALQDAEYRVHNTEQYGGPLDFEEECDTIWDDIVDAISFLEGS